MSEFDLATKLTAIAENAGGSITPSGVFALNHAFCRNATTG